MPIFKQFSETINDESINSLVEEVIANYNDSILKFDFSLWQMLADAFSEKEIEEAETIKEVIQYGEAAVITVKASRYASRSIKIIDPKNLEGLIYTATCIIREQKEIVNLYKIPGRPKNIDISRLQNYEYVKALLETRAEIVKQKGFASAALSDNQIIADFMVYLKDHKGNLAELLEIASEEWHNTTNNVTFSMPRYLDQIISQLKIYEKNIQIVKMRNELLETKMSKKVKIFETSSAQSD